ncbi:MAG: LUD domain-containing protein [Gemmatimonadetes bacterium]|nr:LUD domain-containing protein [Gemmatimonadota bacterium]
MTGRSPTEAPDAPENAPGASHGVGGRDRILRRLRGAIQRRRGSGAESDALDTDHPGPFVGGRPDPVGTPPAPSTALDQFRTMFQLSGGEVVEVADEGAAANWVASLRDVTSVCLGAGAPDLAPTIPKADPRDADLGISRARGAIGETGSLVLDSRDGRRSQLLVPTHVVVVRVGDVHATLADGLTDFEPDLPSALALHSGPSKSADIGQVMVRGVHGPGRVVALILTG